MKPSYRIWIAAGLVVLMGSAVNFYYLWKQNRVLKSVMDRNVILEAQTIELSKQGRIIREISERADTPPLSTQAIQAKYAHCLEAHGHLNLRAQDITDRELAVVLSRLDGIRSLDLAFNDISDASVRMVAGRHTGIEYLNLQKTRVTDKGLRDGVAHLNSLTVLNLSNNAALTDAGVIQALARLTTLTALYLGNQPQITDQSVLRSLTHLRQLETLTLTAIPVTDQSVPGLLRLQNLRVLNVMGTQITERGLTQLVSGLPKLQTIYISRTFISESACAKLQSANPRLEIK